MIRCTIELLPKGDASRARVIGLVEIANVGGDPIHGDYICVLTKTPPFAGALRQKWRSGALKPGLEDAAVIAGEVVGHHRTRRGSYDLLYRALRACGLDRRNP